MAGDIVPGNLLLFDAKFMFVFKMFTQALMAVAVLFKTQVRRVTVQYAVLYCALLYCTVYYSTVQYCTVHYCTVLCIRPATPTLY